MHQKSSVRRRSEDSVSVPRALYCTYPVPLHAHTHFLAAVRPALVLHRVGGQALAAPLLLAGLRLAQDLRHALLMDGVQTLMEKGRRGNGEAFNKLHFHSENTHGSELNQGGGFTSEPTGSCLGDSLFRRGNIAQQQQGGGCWESAIPAPASLTDPQFAPRNSRVVSVGSEATPAFWTSWRLPPECRLPRTCPAACRGRPGSSGWWSPWGCGKRGG